MGTLNKFLQPLTKRIINLFICLAISLLVSSVNATLVNHKNAISTITPASKPALYPDDLWQRIRNGFALSPENRKAVRDNERSFTRNQIYVNQLTDRSKYYLHYIVEEVERRGMPLEIALLPIVESGFDPKALSSSHATGLWQFTPSTGEGFGLIQNQWNDDRMDVIASTNAALDYLQHLDTKFGDWKLALAAYNWGQGSLRKAMARNRKKGLPTTFRHLTLPIETKNHIYKLIAIRNIVFHPAAFGIELDVIPNQPYFDQVETEYPIDIALVANLAGISVQEFTKLNPAHKKGIVRVYDSPRTLLFPIKKIDIFLENIAHYNSANPSTTDHQVRRVITTVTKDVTKDTTIVRSKPTYNRQLGITSSFKKLSYIVRDGDTLAKIADHYNITVKQIKLWNNNNEKITIGQVLTLIVRSNLFH